MSLILRSLAQPYLDNLGLSKYHVEVTTGENTLTVVGECGKPLVYLYGVKFSKSAPDRTEIDLALPLLKDFLDLKYKEITEYITAATLLAETPYVSPNNGKYAIELDYYYSGDVKLIQKIKYLNGIWHVTCKPNGQITAMRLHSKRKMTVPQLNKATLSAKEHKGCIEYVQKFCNYQALKNKVDKLKKDLSACDI